MKGLIIYVVALLAFVVLAPLVARFAWRHGRKLKGGMALAAVLLGVGEPLDPPSKPMVEAKEDSRKRRDAKGEPKDLPQDG